MYKTHLKADNTVGAQGHVRWPSTRDALLWERGKCQLTEPGPEVLLGDTDCNPSPRTLCREAAFPSTQTIEDGDFSTCHPTKREIFLIVMEFT